jgi:hypothetical protein
VITADTLVGRLKAQIASVKSIGASAELDAAIEGTPPTPGLFVIPLAESIAGELETTGGVDQEEMLVFGVAYVVANQRDPRGASALTELVPLRSAVKGALRGWVPDEESGEPVLFRGGRLLRLDGNRRLWWIDEFQVTQWSN